jgi:hypothetical protein
MPPDLPRVQAGFAAEIELAQSSAEAERLFCGSGEQIQRRLGVYRSNQLMNLSTALQGAYPVVAKLVGQDFFAGMTREYSRQAPSTSGDLNQFGASLPAFVEQFAPVTHVPYLPDLARLEWMVHRAFYAADHARLDTSRLAGVPANDQSQLQFRLHPACALMRSEYPVARLWEIHQDDFKGEFAVDPDEPCGWTLVSRPRFLAQVWSMDEASGAFLHALTRNASLADALADAQARDSGFDPGSRLARWIADGVIVDFSVP